MVKKVNVVSNKEWEILRIRQMNSRFEWSFKVIEQQTEEMVDAPTMTNNYASNAAPSEAHFINENKSAKKVEIKDVDTGIDNGKFRIMISYE